MRASGAAESLIERYLTDVTEIHATRANAPETSFYPALERLLSDIGKSLSPKVRCVVNRMFTEPAAPHHRPHFHAYYQDEVGIFAIGTVELIGGDLPQRQRRLVEAWAEIHQNELLDDWNRLQSGLPAVKIEPLR